MSSNKFSTPDLILFAFIAIGSLTFAQDPTTSYTDGDTDLGLEEDVDHLNPEPEAEVVTEEVKKERPYVPERSNVYPYIKEQAPPFHFAVWDETGRICILAKLDASFTITYNTKYGKQQMIDRIDPDAAVDGRCESFLDEKPVMDLKWRGGFTFRLIFDKVRSRNFFIA